jgi:hypothetical protein
MSFEAIKYVTSGLTLVAFLAAVVFELLRRLLKRDSEILRAAAAVSQDSATREKLISLTLERFSVDTQGMSSKDRKELALRQLEERRRRLRLFCFVAVLAFVCLMVVSMVAIFK